MIGSVSPHKVSLSSRVSRAVGSGLAGQTGQRSDSGLTAVEAALTSTANAVSPTATRPARVNGTPGNVSTAQKRRTSL